MKDLSNYSLRQPANQKDILLEQLETLGVNLTQRTRAGVSALVELVPIMEKAKEAGLKLCLPPVPQRQIRRRRFIGDTIRAFEKYDASNLALHAFGEYGMTAGLANQLSAEDMTRILESFE